MTTFTSWLARAAVACVLLAMAPGCGGDVELAPGASPVECPQPVGDEGLSTIELADLVECHYPSADGWRLLRLGGSPAMHGANIGRGSWSAQLVNHVAFDVLTVVYRDGALTAKEASDSSTLETCTASDRQSVPDSTVLVADAIARYGGEQGVLTLRTTHACVTDGTCGRVVVTMGDWIAKTYVYTKDGTFLYELFNATGTGCEHP